MDNYMRAWENKIMWWPTNQECVGCIHKCNLSLQDLQNLGMFTEVKWVKGQGATGYSPNESPLLYHASKCEHNIVLGRLGNNEFECNSRDHGK